MIEIYPLLDFFELAISLPALVLVDLLAHHSVYPIIDRYLSHIFTLFYTILLHIVTFYAISAQVLRCFIALLYTITSRRFYFSQHFLSSTFTVAYCHSFPTA